MNKSFLIGRLTKDIEPKYSSSGNMWPTNTIAVDRKFEKGQTDFINIKAFNKTAEFISKYFHKGSRIAVVGEIRVSQYETENGKRTNFEVVVNEVDFVSDISKREKEKQEYENIEAEFVNLDDMDVPF